MVVSKKMVFKGVIWSLLDTFGNFALKFFFALAITRILTPRDYGLVAYMGLFLGIASWLSEGGFGVALIQKTAPSERDYSTAFFFNVAISLFFFFLYFLLAPSVARYFNEPELKTIMRVTSINLILSSVCYIHLIKLIKHIQFRQQALLNTSASIVSGTTGLVLAIMHFGYWALIFQTLIGALLRMAGLWIIVRWRPSWDFSWTSFREQFRFGSRVFVQGLFESIFREINSLFIGKSFQTQMLGVYARGQKFYDLFVVQTGTAFNKVLYPTMASAKEAAEQQKRMYVTIYSLLFFVMAPLSLFMILFSRPLVELVLTSKWLGAVPVMQLYFACGFIAAVQNFNSSTMLSVNRPGLFLRMDIGQKIALGAALLITYKISIAAIIIGWLIVNYAYFAVYEILMFRIGYNRVEKYNNMLQVFACLLPGAAVYWCTRILIDSDALLLMGNLFLQPLLYLASMRLFRFTLYEQFRNLLQPYLPARLKRVLMA